MLIKIKNILKFLFVDNFIGAFQKAFQFSGRATRREYFGFVLIVQIILSALSVIKEISVGYDFYLIVSILYVLIMIIPIFGRILLFIMKCAPSIDNENKYGINPRI